MKLQKFPTSKLFYNKWPYKILCIVTESWRIKRLGLKKTLDYCYNPDNVFYSNRFRGSPQVIINLLKFTHAMEPFLSKEIQIRSEGNLFNIYCRNTELYNEMISKLDEFISEIHEPINNHEFDYMINNSAKKILCNQFPHKKYQYRIWIKSSFDNELKLKFSQWILNYNNNIMVSTHTHNWLMLNSRYWIPQPSIYVKDSSTLSMVGLFLGNNVQKVEEFVLRSSINTVQ